jgi:hypothetical protein
MTKLGKRQSTLSLANDIKPSAEFFVFTGVTSMLIALALLIIYIILDRQYRNDERYPIIDLCLTMIWTIFWIASSSAWAQGVSNIRVQTSISYVIEIVTGCTAAAACTEKECKSSEKMIRSDRLSILAGTYANVTVSVIFGFLNFFLWLSSVWFIYKETKFFKARTAQQQTPGNNFVNIAAPPTATSSIRLPSTMT